MKLKVILTLFLLFTTHSCAIYERSLLLVKNPCFHLDKREYEIECYKWRDRYPKNIIAFTTLPKNIYLIVYGKNFLMKLYYFVINYQQSILILL